MSNWIFTQKGAVLKSEISVLVPQYVEKARKFQILCAVKSGAQLVIVEDIASYDIAMMYVDKILEEIDSTYKSNLTPPNKEQEEVPQPEEVKKESPKKVKSAPKSEVE